MRVLAVQETDWVERNPILHHRMLEDLSRRGHEVTVVDFEIDWHRDHGPKIRRRRSISDCRKFFPDSRIEVIRPAMVAMPGLGRPSWLAASTWEVNRLLRLLKPDVIVGYGISNAFTTLLLARRYGIPFVYHVLDALHTLPEEDHLKPIARWVESRVMRGADAVVAVNQGLGRYSVMMGAREGRVDVVPMGVTLPASNPELGDAIRKSLGVSQENVVLLFMGFLYEFSGLREMATRLTDIGPAGDGIKLLIVGDGPLMPALKALAAGEKGNRIILTGKRPLTDMPGYLEAADLGLLPAQRNATMEYIVPAKIIEYMEYGLAPIATRLSGLEAEFGDRAGLIYIAKPEEAVEQALLLGSGASARARARELGQTSRRFMESRETWDQVTARFESILQGAAAHRFSAAPLGALQP